VQHSHLEEAKAALAAVIVIRVLVFRLISSTVSLPLWVNC
jgi:hypothetical protein